jgi:hypothetical protein
MQVEEGIARIGSATTLDHTWGSQSSHISARFWRKIHGWNPTVADPYSGSGLLGEFWSRSRFFGLKNLFFGLHEGASSPYKKTSGRSQHEFLHFFSFLSATLACLDPDVNLQSETGSTDPIESGSEGTGENHEMFTELSEYRCVQYR